MPVSLHAHSIGYNSQDPFLMAYDVISACIYLLTFCRNALPPFSGSFLIHAVCSFVRNVVKFIPTRLQDYNVNGNFCSSQEFSTYSNRLHLKYREFILPAICRWLPLHCHACGLSAESTYVNTINEPTGSGNRLLSEKLVTLYNAVLVAIRKFGDHALN